MKLLMTVAAVALLVQPLSAQSEERKRPAGWEVRFDRPNSDASELFFVEMPPGIHVTSGPAGIYYHPDSTASGNYTLSSTIHTFDPKGRNREAFGVIVGGKGLDGPSQDYLYFLIRNSGDFLIKHRAGSDTHVVEDWQPSDAIVKYVAGQEGTATNTLSVTVQNGSVSFAINGTEVAALDANPMLNTDGVFGLRVNHGLDLHVRNLVVSR